jgi:beta-galactosidase
MLANSAARNRIMIRLLFFLFTLAGFQVSRANSHRASQASGSPGATRASTKGFKPIYQVNCGGQRVLSFMEDRYFSGGGKFETNAGVNTSGVPDPPPDEVYQSERYGNFVYHFPDLKPGAEYVVRLHFAEIELSKEAVGVRLFNVIINSKEVLHRFDILAETRAEYKAIAKTFPVNADKYGRISIVFESVPEARSPTVSAIEILQHVGG